MPRTKVSKSSKRNRHAAVDEHIREMELLVETHLDQLEFKANGQIAKIEESINNLIDRTNGAIHDMLFDTFRKLNLKKFADYGNIINTPKITQTKSTTGNDDGYITEDSASSNSTHVLTSYLSTTQRGRTPGPLSSARAQRNRRSRSACTEHLSRSALSQKQSTSTTSTSEHAPRNKLRTPMTARPKAISADRSAFNRKRSSSPPSAFLRWPKPGECVISIHGSPLVAQVVPDRFANVNIPMKNGVLSLRPKKLGSVDTNIVENIDPETLSQIKTLHENLDLIVNLANKKIGNN